ncbi:MAG: GIY-YIG nuclease family protein [Candidatus Omnitrophica bacterium]|nr:GIY-YIG nuclease family protein [Candidatus Omnitrophota bacterium]
MWYVYILGCKDKTLYIGTTKNLTERLDKHNKGKASKYTRGRTPVTLRYQEPHSDKTSALKREHQLKKLSRTKKLALIEDNKAKLSDPARSHDQRES